LDKKEKTGRERRASEKSNKAGPRGGKGGRNCLHSGNVGVAAKNTGSEGGKMGENAIGKTSEGKDRRLEKVDRIRSPTRSNDYESWGKDVGHLRFQREGGGEVTHAGGGDVSVKDTGVNIDAAKMTHRFQGKEKKHETTEEGGKAKKNVRPRKRRCPSPCQVPNKLHCTKEKRNFQRHHRQWEREKSLSFSKEVICAH